MVAIDRLQRGATQKMLARLRRDIARMEGRLADADRLVDAGRLADADRLAIGGVGEVCASGARGKGEIIGKGGIEGEGADTAKTAKGKAAHSDIGRAEAGDGGDPALRRRGRGGHDLDDGRGRIRLGVPRLDRWLGDGHHPGLAVAALHDMRAPEARDGAAAAGFVTALLARAISLRAVTAMGPAFGKAQGPEGPEPKMPGAGVLWISAADASAEAGDLYAPGLAALGFDPARITRVQARRTVDALWAFEAALSCPGLGFAVCEVRRGGDGIDLTATRRCALRARAHGVMGMLLRISGASADEGAKPSAAETRWCVRPVPSRRPGLVENGIGRTAWRLDLEKNRHGRTGSFVVEWNPHAAGFVEWEGAGEADGSASPAIVDPRSGTQNEKGSLHGGGERDWPAHSVSLVSRIADGPPGDPGPDRFRRTG